MELNQAITYLLDGDAILFAGSGFSMGATKEDNSNFSTASPLAHRLLKQCGISESEMTDDLSLASDIFREEIGDYRLVDFLKNEFTAVKITPDQEFIGSLKWQRIYTTNYDNVIELAYQNNRRRINVADMSNRMKDYPDKSGLCLHLNGRVSNITLESLDNDFKLTNTSYLSETFSQSEWLSLFITDLKTAKAIFFIGYSMQYDLDLKRIIYNTPELTDKCFFIMWEHENTLNQRLVKPFGQPLAIGLSGFVENIKLQQKSYISTASSLPGIYLCFKQPETSEISRITDESLYNLLLQGEYDFSSLFYSLINSDNFPYIVHRSKIEDVKHLIVNNDKKNVVVTSELGNGKTIFIQCLASLLLKEGFRVFEFSKYYATLDREIEAICSDPKPTIIIVDNYAASIDVLKSISNFRSDQILIVSERSAMNEVTYDALCDIFQADFENVDINQLDSSEITSLVHLFDHYGVWSHLSSLNISKKEDFIKSACKGRLSNVIIKIIKSPDILRRYKRIIDSIHSKKGYYEALIFILIIQLSNSDLDLEQLALGLDVSQLNSPKFKNDPIIKEFVDFEQNKLKTKSTIISSVLLSEIFDTTLVVDVLINIFTRLNDHRNDKAINKLLRKMMNYSNVQQILNKKDEENFKLNLIRYYESIKPLAACNKNPHFWLQYAIVKLSERNYYMARQFFNTSYSLAQNMDGFETYQIDNHYARYILENELVYGNKATCMDAFKEAHAILIDSKHKQAVRYYPYKVAQLYYPFYEKFFEEMTVDDKKVFLHSCQELLHRLEWYISTSAEGKRRYDVKNTQSSISRIITEQSKYLS